MDAEKLIRCVKKYRELYDYSDAKYSNHKFKEIAWKKIADEVKQPEKLCKRKWLNLRDTYRRLLRKRKEMLLEQPNARVRKWLYEDEISFLIPYFQERGNNSSIDIKFEDVDLLDKEDAKSFLSETPENFIVTHFEDESKGLHSMSPRTSEDVTDATFKEATGSSAPSDELIKLLLKELQDKSKTTKTTANDDFFSSIAKTVDGFKPINQNVVRLKIYSVVSEMEMKELTEHQAVSDVVVGECYSELENVTA